jgi:hypothetical protein
MWDLKRMSLLKSWNLNYIIDNLKNNNRNDLNTFPFLSIQNFNVDISTSTSVLSLKSFSNLSHYKNILSPSLYYHPILNKIYSVIFGDFGKFMKYFPYNLCNFLNFDSFLSSNSTEVSFQESNISKRFNRLWNSDDIMLRYFSSQFSSLSNTITSIYFYPTISSVHSFIVSTLNDVFVFDMNSVISPYCSLFSQNSKSKNNVLVQELKVPPIISSSLLTSPSSSSYPSFISSCNFYLTSPYNMVIVTLHSGFNFFFLFFKFWYAIRQFFSFLEKRVWRMVMEGKNEQ